MAKTATKAKAKVTKGLSPKTFQGLNKKKIEKKTNANAGIRVVLGKGDTIPVQFLQKPTEFTEFETHSFQEGGYWNFVPCAGDACPLCVDESDDRSSTSYRFACIVYNLKEKKPQVLEGPKDLAKRIFNKYDRGPKAMKNFTKKTYDITRFEGTPTTYEVSVGDDDTVTIGKNVKVPTVEEYLTNEMKRFYGEDLEAAAAGNSLDDDDVEDEELEDEVEEDEEELDLEDDDDEEEEEDEDEDSDDDADDEEDEDDEEDDDEDFDLDDDDEDDEEEEEVKPAKKPAKKAPAKKAVAKKVASKKKK